MGPERKGLLGRWCVLSNIVVRRCEFVTMLAHHSLEASAVDDCSVDIQITLNGRPIGAMDLPEEFLAKAAAYQFLKRWGLTFEEVRFLSSPESDRLLSQRTWKELDEPPAKVRRFGRPQRWCPQSQLALFTA